MEELARPQGDVPFGWALALWRWLVRRRQAARPTTPPPTRLDTLTAWPGFLRW